MTAPPKNPLELLEKQTQLLAELRDEVIEIKRELKDSNENQENLIRLTVWVNRAARLYFILTVIGLILGGIYIVMNLAVILTILKILIPALRR